ncbi:MAG: hypothetical protein DI527_11770 [Chelatococcus sp.]|nr:MAG: hypothetical protein DI527_11770 [Chelatococcus sp.]
MRFTAAFVSLLLLSGAPVPAHDLTPFQEPGPSHVLHRDVSPSGEETINVETYVAPACAAKPCPLVIAIHGLNRDAGRARDEWIEAADRYGLIVAAPHFDRERFPTRLFQQGGVRDRPDSAGWVFATVERFFDRALASGRVAGTGYVLFGHSAGAQFVQRMVLFSPQARFSTAVAANAGYYTLPVGKEAAGGFDYPYSLGATPLADAPPRAAFARRMLVMLGDRDTDPDHAALNRSRGARAQGADRFTRGRDFMTVASAEAARIGAALNWRQIVVPGVAHESGKMASAAAQAVFGAP